MQRWQNRECEPPQSPRSGDSAVGRGVWMVNLHGEACRDGKMSLGRKLERRICTVQRAEMAKSRVRASEIAKVGRLCSRARRATVNLHGAACRDGKSRRESQRCRTVQLHHAPFSLFARARTREETDGLSRARNLQSEELHCKGGEKLKSEAAI